MHIDREGVQHPITLKVALESEDQFFASCEKCSARWAGPFLNWSDAISVVRIANEDSLAILPHSLRNGPCCSGMADDEAADDEAADDEEIGAGIPTFGGLLSGFGYGAIVAVTIGVTAVVGIARGLAASARALAGLGRYVVPLAVALGVAAWGLGRLVGGVHVPAASIGIGIFWVLGAVMAIAALVGFLRWARKNLDSGCSTPLTTSPRETTVGPISKPPADERPKGRRGEPQVGGTQSNPRPEGRQFRP